MDPPADHRGEEVVSRRPPLHFPPLSTAPSRETTFVVSRYTGLLGILFVWALVSTITNNILLPSFVNVPSSRGIDHSIHDDTDNHINLFQPTEFYKHIQQRQSNYVHHNNLTHSSQSTTFGTGSNSHIRISFQLHDNKTQQLENIFNPYVRCFVGKVIQGRGNRQKPTGEVRDGILPPTLKSIDQQSEDYPRSGRILDFRATISTNLNILQIGDSVLVQLAQAFDEMVGCRSVFTGSNNGTDTGFCRPRDLIWQAWLGHDGRSLMAPTIGGGASAMWRMTALLSKSAEGKPPANEFGGGWSMPEVESFLKHYVPWSEDSDGEQIGNSKLERFDAVLFRVQHGWMKINDITNDRLVEAVELSHQLLGAKTLSHQLLGAKTVILMTIPFTNNVNSVEEAKKVDDINNNIREIAHGWHLRNSTGVKHVLVLEYGTYYNHIIWTNARHIGYNVSAPLMMTNEMFDTEGKTFLHDRLVTGKEWPPSIAMVCSKRAWLNTAKAKCHRNYLFSDGMHICPETLAARYGVVVACLLGCVYNGKPGANNDDLQRDEAKLRACERDCNEQFMSVMPVEESWVDSNTELASFAL
ncbi:hypothetical protein ACHAWC_005282 [Mediolabrus comicus]